MRTKTFRNVSRGFTVKAYQQKTTSGTVWILYQVPKFKIVLQIYDFERRYELIK